MTYDEALRKAIGCLKLSQSANKDEAALAASKAQEIIDKYNLCIDDIQQGKDARREEEPIVNFGNDPLHEVCQVDSGWTMRLASTIAKLNSCRIYFTSKFSGSVIVKVIGRPKDVQVVRYIFGWLESEVRRITREECRGFTRRYQIDFRNGVVDTIYNKLQAQRKETLVNVQKEAVNTMALVRIQNSIAEIERRGSAVDEWVKLNLKLRQTTTRRRTDFSARQHGQVVGERVRITKAVGSLE
jgi:hypothetical protein